MYLRVVAACSAIIRSTRTTQSGCRMIDSKRSLPRIAAWLASLGLLAACSSAPPPPHDAVPVTVAKVARKSMPELIAAVGTVEAINGVAMKSLVDGQLLESHVKDGDEVKAGQLL